MARTARRRQGQIMTPEERQQTQDAFLESFAKCGVVLRAASAAGVDRRTIYDWKANDEAFAARYEIAEADANDVVRDEIRRRGVTGWTETTTTVEDDGAGNITTKTVKVHKFSDAMIKLLAQSRMPEFRDKLDVTSNEHTLGAYRDIERIASTPELADAACDLLSEITNGRQYAGGARVDSQPGQ